MANHFSILAIRTQEQYERQKNRTLKDELPRSVGAQHATGDQWRNNSRKNEDRAPPCLGFSKARMPSSRASCQTRDRTHNISCKAGRFFTTEPPRKPESTIFQLKKKKAPRKVLMIALRPISGASDNSFYFLGLNFHLCKFIIMNILSHSLYLSTVGIQRNITCKK